MHALKYGLLIMFLSSVTVYLWSCVKGLCGNTQVTIRLEWEAKYIMSIYMLVNGLFSTYLSLLLLWMFSIVCLHTTDELEKVRKEEKLKPKHGERCSSKEKKVTANDSIMNVGKFIALFEVWLYEEQNVKSEMEPVKEKIYKLQSGSKQLKRIQIIIDTLKTQTLYSSQKDISKSKKIQDLLDKFDYIKAYIELRQRLLILVEKQFSVFLEQGKELKIWLSEAVEFHEGLHHVSCDSHVVIQQQLSQTQVIQKQSKMMAGKLEKYEITASELTAMLQEIGSISNHFHITLRKDTGQPGKRWSDTLMNSVTDEMTQVADRFSMVFKLNSCYQTHLQGLLKELL